MRVKSVKIDVQCKKEIKDENSVAETNKEQQTLYESFEMIVFAMDEKSDIRRSKKSHFFSSDKQIFVQLASFRITMSSMAPLIWELTDSAKLENAATKKQATKC